MTKNELEFIELIRSFPTPEIAFETILPILIDFLKENGIEKAE